MSGTEKIEQICAGNRDAAHFCHAFCKWVHFIDDAVDQDKSYTVPEIAQLTLEVAEAFSENPFFQKHREALMALIFRGFSAWEDSIAWEKREDSRDRAASQVLKSAYHDVFWHVALLVGGPAHARAMTAAHREFDYDL